MFNRFLIVIVFSLLTITLIFSHSFSIAELNDYGEQDSRGELNQYGEVYSIYNNEVKMKVKNPLTGEINLFKFDIGWGTAFEGVGGLDGIKNGDYINVSYTLDSYNKARAVKITFPKDLSSKTVSPSGIQTYDANEPLVKSLQEEVKSLKSELNNLKEELKKQQVKE